MDSKLNDEYARVSALQRYQIMDTPPEPALDRITSLVRTVLDAPIAAISTLDSTGLWIKSGAGVPGGYWPRADTFCSHTVRQRTPLLVSDATLDERFARLGAVQGDLSVRSYLGIPLSSPDGYVVGSLCGVDRRVRDFTPAQIALMQSFGEMVVNEMELRLIGQTDGLTSAMTRRGFLLAMENAIASYIRSYTPACVLIADIDCFRLINEKHGHTTGDEVLAEARRVLSSILRKQDVVGRLGGKSFGILLKNTDLRHACKIAERARERLASMVFLGRDTFSLTASFGVAELEGDAITPETWLAGAERSLQVAKRFGRNRVSIAHTGEPQEEGLLAA